MSDSPPPPRRPREICYDPEWVDFLAHEMVGLLPRDLPREQRLAAIRRWLDEVERVVTREGLVVPPWVQRARELYLRDDADG